MTCKLQKCGHCDSLVADDHCGKPEHRYCSYCKLKEASDDSDTWGSYLHDAIEAALKELDETGARNTPSVANAIKILKEAAKS